MKEKETATHWAKDALIKLSIVLMIFSSNTVFSQKELSGEYYLHSDSIGIKVVFKKDKEFYYTSSTGHDKYDYGYGNYKIENKLLSLNFDLTKSKIKSYDTVDYKETVNDSVLISFNVFSLLDKKGLLSPILNIDNREVRHTKKDGYGSFNFKKSNKETEFKITPIGGFDFYTIKTKLNSNAHFNVFLDITNGGIPIFNEIYEYKIRRLDKNVLILENEKGEKQKWKKKTPKS